MRTHEWTEQLQRKVITFVECVGRRKVNETAICPVFRMVGLGNGTNNYVHSNRMPETIPNEANSTDKIATAGVHIQKQVELC